jgi:hypothetical protein
MALETGGRGDKLGNRYEGRWLATQLLRLLEEEIRYIVVEPIGDDEQGVEFFIELKNNVRQFHQCKARNASEESWSVNKLKSKNVIKNIKFQLDRQQHAEFIFVSGVPVTNLGDVCDSARNSPDNAEQFYLHQIKASGPRNKVFVDFCKAVGKDHENQEDRNLVYNYLIRIHMRLFSGDLDQLYSTARYLLSGDPELAIATMLNYFESHEKFGKRIYADDLVAYLNEKKIYLKDLAHDYRVFPAIELLQKQFLESIEPQLIRAEFLDREEIALCIEALNENGLVLIHGEAGKGKSSVLYGIAERLKELHIPFIPIRVDRQIPKDSAQRFGENIGLPDSPALCVAALAIERPTVLLIDQLDAIRWTSSHSANALEVCKELIRQVKNARLNNKDVRVIMSCRTFDLNYDPEIRHWLNERDIDNNEIWRKIELGELSKEIIQYVGADNYMELNHEQQLLLSNAQNLFMWCQIIDSGYSPLFQSATDLLEIYWKEKIGQIEKYGVSLFDINQILDRLCLYMEKNNENSSPRNIVTRFSPKALEMLQSHGIIQEVSARISFCHQIYLDHLIARKVIDEIEQGNSILDWLGAKDKQTLFRREQLRQVLGFLSQQKTSEFINTVQLLLFNQNVRFHFKQLVLEIWSGIKENNPLLISLTLDLLADQYWNPYMIETVIYNNAFYTKLLIDKGILDKWLFSSDEAQISQALWLLRSVIDKIPDDAARLLRRFLEANGARVELVHQTLEWNLPKDSNDLFALRMELANMGYYPYSIDWKEICELHPHRAIQLIEMYISRERDIEENPKNEKWYEHDMMPLLALAENEPQEIWNKLLPCVLNRVDKLDIYELGNWKRFHEYDVLSASIELIIKAGMSLAQYRPKSILKKINMIDNQSSPLLKYVLAQIYTCLPETYSDNVITWILNDISRLEIGEEFNEPIYKLSGELILKFSPFCSNELFDSLEKLLLRYHGDEIRRRKFYIKHKESRYFNVRLGLTQYTLLNKLCPQRMNEITVELLVVLSRKITAKMIHEFETTNDYSMAKFVGSTLDKNVLNISDKAWLKIVVNKKVVFNRLGSFKDSEDGESYIESSISQFSNSLERAANNDPERFARLLLSFPIDVHPAYVAAIFRAFSITIPDNSLVEEEKRLKWKPVSLKVMVMCIDKFYKLNDREEAIAFCRLLRERASEDWPDRIIDKLILLATEYPDLNLDSHEWDGDMHNASVNDLTNKTLNCVRGVAAYAIGNLLWEKPSRLTMLKSAIDSLVNYQPLVVRMAAIYPLIPIINIDKELAINWFERIPQGDFRIIIDRYGMKFISYMMRSHNIRFKPILKAMLNSSNEEVSQKIGNILTGSYLFYDLFENEIHQICLNGSLSQKRGIAKTAAYYVGKKEFSEKCRDLLIWLIDRNGKELTNEISDMFRHNPLKVTDNIELFKYYLKSEAFNENSMYLHELKKYEGSLLEYSELIFSLFDIFAIRTDKKRNNVSRLNFTIDEAIKLLLRLYDQSKDVDTSVFQKCLDTWDILFEKRIVYAKRIINETGMK